MRALLSCAIALAVAPATAGAQLRVPPARFAPPLPSTFDGGEPGRLPERPQARAGIDGKPGLAMIGSAIVPGAGQYLLRENRWVPYLVVEVWAWISYFDRHGNARSTEREYRDLAWLVPRGRLTGGERRDSIFEYYEAMSHWQASGAFDVDPRTEGVQPERDLTTFNGDMWALARSLYSPGGGNCPTGSESDGCQRALAYYLEHAIPPGYLWAWGASNLEQKVFAELIEKSDGSFRSATRFLGIILANHLISAVDALVVARTRSTSPAGARIRVGGGFEPDPRGWRLEASLKVVW
jgi:hypothetical protein